MTVTKTRIDATPQSGGRTTAALDESATNEQTKYPTQGSTALRAERPDQFAGETRPRSAPRLRVAPPLPVAVPRTPFILLILLIVVAGVLGILVLNTKINENAFRLHDLQQSQINLDQHEQQLKQQIANYEAPGNLAAAACRLGMVPAGAPAFIRLPDGRIIGVPQPAAGKPCRSGQQASTGAQQGSSQQGNSQQVNGTGR
jgi:hypothetical protein